MTTFVMYFNKYRSDKYVEYFFLPNSVILNDDVTLFHPCFDILSSQKLLDIRLDLHLMLSMYIKSLL